LKKLGKLRKQTTPGLSNPVVAHSEIDRRVRELIAESVAKSNPRRIWQELVLYANCDASTSGWMDETALANFVSLVSAGMELIGGEFDDVKACRDLNEILPAAGEKLELLDALEALAKRYQPEVKNVLKWLSDPPRYGALAFHASDFLMQHGNEIKMHWEGQSHPEDQMLIVEWPDECGSVISPICKFVKDQIDRYQSGEEKLRAAIPVGLCVKPGCGKFRVIKLARPGLLFCSNSCKASFHQANKTKEEKREYMRRHRATLDRNKPTKTRAKQVVKRAGAGAGRRTPGHR